MKIIFCTTMFYDADADIRASKNPRPMSGHKYQQNILEGLLENGVDVTVVNIPRIRRFPDYRKIAVRRSPFQVSGRTCGVNVGFVNLYGVNYLTQYLSVKREVGRLLRDTKDSTLLMAFNTYFPQTFVIQGYARGKNVYSCDLVGDINGPRFGQPIPFTGLKKKLLEKYTDIQFNRAQRFDGYVLHTEPMAQALEVGDRPYVLMECPLRYPRLEKLEFEEKREKLIFYAGAISREYGIDHLLNAFSLIEDPDYRFVLAGKGPMEGAVREYCEKDPRATYLGFVAPTVVDEYQNRADALVNPRTSKYNFVKYSFPSKNMECIASGRPFVAHRLDCIPGEYDPYILYPASESDEDLAAALVEACNLPAEEKVRRGLAGNRFIVEQKNPRVLTRRVVDLLKKIVGE